jgi:hypothetical protein
MPESSDIRISLSAEKEASASIAQTASVLNQTSLGANATPPSALSNLFHSNVVASTNLSAQNASSLQNALAKINLSALGKAIENVQGGQAAATRSRIEVLTNNEVAELIASLRAVQSELRLQPIIIIDPLLRELYERFKRLLEKLRTEVEVVEAINGRISGDGTQASPYSVSGDFPLYVKAPITLGFDVPPSQVSIEQLRNLFGLTS